MTTEDLQAIIDDVLNHHSIEQVEAAILTRFGWRKGFVMGYWQCDERGIYGYTTEAALQSAREWQQQTSARQGIARPR